jgi:hypothetical protein
MTSPGQKLRKPTPPGDPLRGHKNMEKLRAVSSSHWEYAKEIRKEQSASK